MVKTLKAINWLPLILCIVVIQSIGFLSSLLSGDIRQTYNNLNQPPFSPPGPVFGIVWPILYLFIGIALYLLISAQVTSGLKRISLILFGAQLLINFLWTIIFFSGNNYWLGFALIILLDILVIACIAQFSKVQVFASYLMVPYLIWILFATYLSFGVAWLN
ncbi:tryptophan-rich sensory protein [Lactobacillus sp. CC-MHH1034]|uniref:TspO/MBR family protein n=1 Tax=Agrilactobacillus fermenti TaxID=2586909 RepID=UPI001E4CAC93|nr:TspO/MBR family protein [Agrilactobacillus fermenti]MCD2257135.1 tryptophan-rich sensory protein [Agrilactobacillus fermenti]